MWSNSIFLIIIGICHLSIAMQTSVNLFNSIRQSTRMQPVTTIVQSSNNDTNFNGEQLQTMQRVGEYLVPITQLESPQSVMFFDSPTVATAPSPIITTGKLVQKRIFIRPRLNRILNAKQFTSNAIDKESNQVKTNKNMKKLVIDIDRYMLRDKGRDDQSKITTTTTTTEQTTMIENTNDQSENELVTSTQTSVTIPFIDEIDNNNYNYETTTEAQTMTPTVVDETTTDMETTTTINEHYYSYMPVVTKKKPMFYFYAGNDNNNGNMIYKQLNSANDHYSTATTTTTLIPISDRKQISDTMLKDVSDRIRNDYSYKWNQIAVNVDSDDNDKWNDNHLSTNNDDDQVKAIMDEDRIEPYVTFPTPKKLENIVDEKGNYFDEQTFVRSQALTDPMMMMPLNDNVETIESSGDGYLAQHDDNVQIQRVHKFNDVAEDISQFSQDSQQSSTSVNFNGYSPDVGYQPALSPIYQQQQQQPLIDRTRTESNRQLYRSYPSANLINRYDQQAEIDNVVTIPKYHSSSLEVNQNLIDTYDDDDDVYEDDVPIYDDRSTWSVEQQYRPPAVFGRQRNMHKHIYPSIKYEQRPYGRRRLHKPIRPPVFRYTPPPPQIEYIESYPTSTNRRYYPSSNPIVQSKQDPVPSSSTMSSNLPACSTLRDIAKNQFKVTSLPDFVRKNCTFVQIFFPHTTCEQIYAFVDFCYSQQQQLPR